MKPLQRTVEDLCKLGQASQIMTQVKDCLEKAIKARFDSLSQLATQPSIQTNLLEKANEFWAWLCHTALLLHSAFQTAEQTLILEES